FKEVYSQYCTPDNELYEHNPFTISPAVFPYNLSSFIGKDYSKISSTPQGNDFTIEMAKAAVVAENLGNNAATDFLAVSISSTDYIGHSFGPDSWEQLDDFIKLDKTLNNFLNFLDAKMGKGNYTLFLTADHGVANSPGFSKEHNLPGGSFDNVALVNNMNKLIKEKTGFDSMIVGIYNYQVVINHSLLKEKNLEEEKLIAFITEYLMKQDAVSVAFDIHLLNLRPMNEKQRQMLMNGYYNGRSGSIQIILKPGYVEGNGIGTTHGLWNPYDSHIPLLWYGWGIKQGKSYKEYYMTDIAATLATLLHIQMPSGCVGNVIEEVMK
ncbi:MAG: alkaline phosphatase family protein, partial [Parafilimonas sp.]